MLEVLGDLSYKIAKPEEATKNLKEAIDICEQVFPTAAGAFRGTLALILAEQGHTKEALSALKKGEPQVEVHPLEHGKFLCKKAKVLFMDNQTEEAKKALQQANDIAKKLNLKDDSELGKSIADVAAIIHN